MVFPKEPVPGQKLDATWGRDVVRALRRLTPSGGPGMRVTCGPNGTTFAAVGRSAQTAAAEQAESELLPFRIGVGVETVKSGSSIDYKYHCVSIVADLSTDGVGYNQINTTVADDKKLGGLPIGKAGSGLAWAWLKNKEFEDVTEEDAKAPTEKVYLHIDRTRRLCVLANAETLTIPDGTEFASDDHICVARFTAPTDDVPKPSVCGQYVLGSLVDLCEVPEPHPFKAEYFNAGTEAKPDWRLTVFTPDDAVDTSNSALYSQVSECDARAGWAEVEASALHADKTGLATLALRFCTAASADWTVDEVRTYAQFGTVGYAFDSSGINGFDSTRAVYATLPIAVIDTANRKVVQQLAFSAFSVQAIPPSTSGGGSGMDVSVTDSRTDKEVPGLIGLDGATQAEGKLKLIAYDALGFDKVVAGDAASHVTLPEYLAGDAEVTAGGTALGKNVNTVNFGTECLAESGGVSGSQSVGARADHKHTLDEILMEGEDGSLLPAFSNVETYTKLLRDMGAITEEDTAAIPNDEQMVTFGNITQGVDGTIGAEGIGSDTSDIAPLADDKAEYIATEAELAGANVHQGEWDRDTDTSGKGFKYTVCCGIKYIPSKYGVYLIFREITVDKYGMIRKISKAKMGLYQNLV